MNHLNICEKELHGKNVIYNENTNKLVREITGDIAYIDPPYTTTQKYTNSYHILETITRYDSPLIFGKLEEEVIVSCQDIQTSKKSLLSLRTSLDNLSSLIFLLVIVISH